MKLLTKINLYTLTVTIVLFSIGSFIIYHEIIARFDKEAEEHLRSTKNRVIGYLKNGVPPQEMFQPGDYKNSIKEISKQTLFKDTYSTFTERDKYIEEEEEDEEEETMTYKAIQFQVKVKNKIYEIRIANSLSEGNEIGKRIMTTVILFLFFSTITLLLLNQFISKVIWKPFNSSVDSITKWQIEQPLALEKTNIHEFKLLNTALIGLTEKIKLDYQNLKEFTENISHETQTPLTILSNKLELLLQENNYNNDQARLLSDSYQAVQRLYKLNKTLVLLSKIENGQFIGKEKLDLNEEIQKKIKEYDDFIESKKISVKMEFQTDVHVDMNPVLMNVLLDNLFLNAIKYNVEGGEILFKIEKDSLNVLNTSALAPLSEKQIFERIKRTSTSGSLGIGLSLVKKISDLYGWIVSYQYVGNKHSFMIRF
ncbi:MAG: sensor histidine kinase [Bacteroidia bacterium]